MVCRAISAGGDSGYDDCRHCHINVRCESLASQYVSTSPSIASGAVLIMPLHVHKFQRSTSLSEDVTIEFIPIKPLAATGSGGPRSYAGHSRFPLRHPGRPASTGGFDDATALDTAVDMLDPQSAGVGWFFAAPVT